MDTGATLFSPVPYPLPRIMIISAKNLPNYFEGLVFPFPVLAERGDEVVMEADRADLEQLAADGVVTGVGSWTRLKHVRLNRPLHEAAVKSKPLTIRNYAGWKATYREELHNAAGETTHYVTSLKRISERDRHLFRLSVTDCMRVQA